MTTDFDSAKAEVFIYHVTRHDGAHQFLMINSYFLRDDGGQAAFESRLSKQFHSFQLLGTCAVSPFATGAGSIDETAAAEIMAKTKAIARQHPGCDPFPHPWVPPADSDDELAMLRTAVMRIAKFTRLRNEIKSDLAQILADVDGVLSVVAIIHYHGNLRAGLVLQTAESAGFAPAENNVPSAHMTLIPDPAKSPGHWKTIPPATLSTSDTPYTEDQPAKYLVLRSRGRTELALPGHHYEGKVGWSGNAELIDCIQSLMVELGLVRGDTE
jgi:hypothetical protein